MGTLSFLGFAVISFGGPLALAGLIAPGVIAGAGSGAGGSAGLALLIATVVFAVPLLIWLRYAREVHGSGGLYDFVRAAAGPQVAFAQAAIWALSYLLYIVYTTEQIVYYLLPNVFTGVQSLQTLLALLIPVVLCAVMVGGRRVALITAGLLAVTQLALVGVLDGVTIASFGFPASSFGAAAPAGGLAKAGFQSSLLYVCGSLPLFLGGELARPAVTIRRGLSATYLLTALVVVLAVAPLAGAPAFLGAGVSGVAVAQRFVGTGLADALGIGIALSIGGVMLAEYFALTRLVHAVTSWRLRPVTLVIAVFVLAAAPLMLINPDGLYSALIQPSLVALWLSQVIVFAVYPRFAQRRGQRLLPACALSLTASGLAIYGLVITLQQATS
ncbi:MAG: APC family permease [Acidobacteriota bacterium]|nr:APC family permease [Acidobacteriota bacterium]